MSTPILQAFISGALALAYAIAGVFFLRFWRRTQDGLFLAFAIAFALLAANYVAPIAMGVSRDLYSEFYIFRLAAFALIILAIVRKNARGRG